MHILFYIFKGHIIILLKYIITLSSLGLLKSTGFP